MKTLLNSALITFLAGAILSTPVNAQVGGETNAEFSAVPPESERTDPPEVMLSLSRDHQYFFKAYNDYTDLDPEEIVDPDTGDVTFDVDEFGNPNIETTYKHSFDYFGYFDAYKCYGRTNNRFIPLRINSDKYCSGSEWSGNFLNWATMTRMDVVRKIFYGGKRVIDDNNRTVLRRAFLPHDAHSFAKYYNGDDIDRLTPFNNVRVNGRAGDPDDELDNLDEGITLCNTTHENGGSSQDSTSPPLLRVALGNFQLWGANERWQCTWSDENGNRDNSNRGPSNPVTAADFPASPAFEGLNSGIDASDRDPVRADNREFEVDVEACVENLIGRERCKVYPNGQVKPIGLLQIYGDEGLINFGLMTGSYENNIEGGVLRKNTGPLSDEVDVTGSGRFTFTDTSDSIIKFLDRIRPWGYSYNNGTYLANGNAGDDCPFQLTDVPNGRCNSWGNPISEVYKETIRYLSGLNPTNDFASNDTTFIRGLTDADWQDPLDANNQCADLNTIVINASVSSYDSDNTDIADVRGGINGTNIAGSAATTTDWTNMIGVQEGIHGGNFFIGRTGADADEFCSSKRVDQLAEAAGLCPEAPTVEGSFDMAGIAYYAHNNDIRADLDGNQTVNTFAIALATNVPIINVPRSIEGATPVQILPAYRLFRGGGEGGGALVDFKIVKPHARVGDSGDNFSASYYVNWEDSEQGGDYDQDVWGLIDYVLDESANTITITTTVFGESTVNPQLFGFVTNGTTTDGFHAYSGIENADFVSPFAAEGVPGCENCNSLYSNNNPVNAGGQQGPQSHTFSISPSTAGVLESPLYYAAKYGGFEENLAEGETVTVDDMPDELDEWDNTNNTTGLDGADGLPDNFFFVINPENLFNSLEASLNKILLEERAANSSVANFAGSNGFENIIIQGTYQELTREEEIGPDGQIREVQWSGEVFSYFIDDFGTFREDSNQDGVLTDLDRAFRFDLEGDIPRIQYLTISTDLTNGLPTLSNSGEPVAISELNTLWSGGDSLRNINNQDTVLQRPYNSVVPSNPNAPGASRYIFTHLDLNRNGRVDTGEQMDFLAANIDDDNFGFFGVGDTAVARNIVNYVRGFDDVTSTGLRNRTLNIDGQEVTYRLGDLVNSTPLVVAGPNEGYDVSFNDESYETFLNRYADRRQVAYVGANDGLLHAFNVGFRERENIQVGVDASGNPEFESVVSYNQTGSNNETAHPLGAELWAYAPYNLLPHLQWLTSNFYSHVFYVDGDPQSFDVKIFPESDTHPGGWGTILVVAMRQGGGDFLVEADGTRSTARSAYIVIDITDPEQEPTVLAEITHPDLNLTTSKPDLFYDCGANCEGEQRFDGDWKLVFGSGPTEVKTLTTNEDAKIFTYDLETRDIEVDLITTGNANPIPNSHVGDIASRDWDNRLLGFRNDDVAYFGTVGREQSVLPGSAPGNLDRETGAVYRFFPRSRATNLLFDANRPVVQRPVTLSRESLGNDVLGSWVYFGTGQYLKRADETISDQERFYGLIEPVNQTDIDALNTVSGSGPDQDRENSDLLLYTTVRSSSLIDVTDVQVRPDGNLVNPVSSPLGGTAETFAELSELVVRSTQGWFRDLPLGIAPGEPSLRVIDRTAVVQDQLLFTGFTPASEDRLDICIGGEGSSDLFVVNQTTGTASPFGTLGTTTPNGDILETQVSLGDGLVSAPTVFTSEALGSNSGKIIVQRPDGSVIQGRTRCDGTVTFDPDEAINSPCDDGTNRGTNIADIKVTRSSWRELYQQAEDR